MPEDRRWQLPGHPVHPGPFLGEELEARGISVKSFAEQIGRPLGEMLAVVQGGALIDEELAREVGDALDTGHEGWANFTTLYLLTLERDYRRDVANDSIAAAD